MAATYTDETLQNLPGEGVTSVQVVCPGFSADCLETIEEIGMENRDFFLEAGGTRYEYIPCLNAQDRHLSALTDLISEELAGWLNSEQNPERTEQLARQLGSPPSVAQCAGSRKPRAKAIPTPSKKSSVSLSGHDCETAPQATSHPRQYR
ncbi:MAG: hypothetical protein CM15mP74_18220 [Halieaceae bacterium]|nr:MAG: hypothetical protein CM15mP74_18220 [Halieaceae bacterium]